MMNDQEYIRAGVELADGWTLPRNESGVEYILGPHFSMIMHFNHLANWMLDALAAQLVRQVDESGRGGFYSVPGAAEMQWEYENSDELDTSCAKSPDRTMNTIKAIVDSEVLADKS